MPLRKKSPPIPPDAILECVESHASDVDGVPVFFARGMRLRRDRIKPFSERFWVADGSDELDISRARQQMFESAEPTVDHVELNPPVPMVECVKPLSTVGRAYSPAQTLQTGMAVISVGDRLPKSHALVAQFPDHFKPVKE